MQQIKSERELDRYQLFGNNRVVQTDNSPEILLAGPTRTGKSFSWLVKLHRYATRYKKFRGLIVRKTRASLSESVLQTLEEHVMGMEHPAVFGGPRRAYRQLYTYPNGAQLILDGMDVKTKIMSTEFDMIYCPEATEFTIDDIEYLTTRLSNTGVPLGKDEYWHQLVLDCNPDHPKHWLKLRCDSGKTTLFENQHKDNPKFYNHQTNDWTPLGYNYVFHTLNQLSGVRKKRFKDGLWVAAEGAIYEDWNDAVHIIDPIELPHDWPRIRVIDFGYKNPFVCLWIAVEPSTSTLYVYREIYKTGELVEDLAPLIKRLTGEERIIETICDHDAEDRATLIRHGIPNVPAMKAVGLGIAAVQSRLKVLSNNVSRLYFFRDCLVERDSVLVDAKMPTCTVEEIPGYVWAKNKDGKSIKEEPVKLDDHGCDTLRYAVAYVDNIGIEISNQEYGILEDEGLYDTISPY